MKIICPIMWQIWISNDKRCESTSDLLSHLPKMKQIKNVKNVVNTIFLLLIFTPKAVFFENFFSILKFPLDVCNPSQAKLGRSLEILYRDLFNNASHPVCVCLSPHSPPTPVKLEAWKLACIIFTLMAPKLQIRFLIFGVESEIFKFKVLYLRLW